MSLQFTKAVPCTILTLTYFDQNRTSFLHFGCLLLPVVSTDVIGIVKLMVGGPQIFFKLHTTLDDQTELFTYYDLFHQSV